MALAQDTDILLLDEPTTYLDLAHQIEILDLLFKLNLQQDKTIVMVLHDINQACRYAEHLIALKSGKICAEGEPAKIISAALIKTVFGLKSCIIVDPVSGSPLCIPIGCVRGSSARF